MKRRITFASFGPKIASSRLRAEIPQRELASLGIEAGRDVLVIGKHGWEWDKVTKGFARVVYDVCDDHFGDNLSAHYLGACARADAVTCNSHVMRDIVKAKTGRDAWVIPDPWESPECAPRTGRSLLWFGHRRNLRDVTPWLDKLAGRDLTIVTKLQGDEPVIGGVRWVDWSPDEMARQFQSAGLVLIPTGVSMAKSANRAIESIRRGVFPVCGYLPAHGDLGVYQGDIAVGVEWALGHHDEVIHRLRAMQGYVRWQYAPTRIAKLWLEALSYV